MLVGVLVAALDCVSGDAVADSSAVDVARDVSTCLVDVLLDNAEGSCVVSVLEEVSFCEQCSAGSVTDDVVVPVVNSVAQGSLLSVLERSPDAVAASTAGSVLNVLSVSSIEDAIEPVRDD